MDPTAVEQAQGVRWDLTSYFPTFDGPEMRAFKTRMNDDLDALATDAAALGTVSSENANAWAKVLLRLEDISGRMSHIMSYVNNLSSADASDERYSQELARLSKFASEYEK